MAFIWFDRFKEFYNEAPFGFWFMMGILLLFVYVGMLAVEGHLACVALGVNGNCYLS